ncbi:MAG: hypothetical protein HN867_05650 [Deltaproteobacteria bacterium]|nr:hypothetical protein [Deltaproteobacteria bacterium]
MGNGSAPTASGTHSACGAIIKIEREELNAAMGHNLELVLGRTSGSRIKPQQRHLPQQLNPQFSSGESKPSPPLHRADVRLKG